MRLIPSLLSGTKPTAYAAFDLASRRDICSCCFAIPRHELEEIWVDVYSWIPRGALETKEPALKEQYEDWAANGWITIHEAKSTRFKLVLADFYKLASETYEVAEVLYDPWAAEMFVQDLEDEGFTCREFRQGYRTMSPAMRYVEADIYEKKIRHDGNPLLRWAIANLKVDQDPAGGMKPNKPKSTAKIDPAVSMIMATAWANEKMKDGQQDLSLSMW